MLEVALVVLVMWAVCCGGLENVVHAGAGAVMGARRTRAHLVSGDGEPGCCFSGVTVAHRGGREWGRIVYVDPGGWFTEGNKWIAGATSSGGGQEKASARVVRLSSGGGGQLMWIVCIDEHTTTQTSTIFASH